MSNVVRLPSAVNPVASLEAAVCQLRSLCAELEQHATMSSFNFASAERRIHEAAAGVEVAALAQVARAAEPTAEVIEVDGVEYRRMSEASAGAYLGLRGRIELQRPLYRQIGVHNGPTVDPIALRCGLVEGRLTPAAAVAFGHLQQAMPSREAQALCSSLGVLPYSRSALHRNGTLVGQVWDQMGPDCQQQLMDDTRIPEQAASVSVSVDRVALPMAEDRPATERDQERGVRRPISVEPRMAYCAVWTLHDRHGEALHSVRYAHVPHFGSAMIEAALADDLSALLKRRPELSVVTLADGAPEMQYLLDRVVEGVTVQAQLVDFWHLTEKLAAAARAVGRSAQQSTASFARMLLDDDRAIEQIELELRTWAPRGHPTPQGLNDALTYIENHRERLRYASARARGLPIGSGHVEATCKTIVSVRFKRAGARWRPHGAQPLLRLRALATSSRWEPAMKMLTDSYVVPVAEAA